MFRIQHAVLILALLVAGCATGSNDRYAGDGAYERAPEGSAETYDKETILTEAGDFLGEGAEGLGKVISSIFADLGEPNAYIRGSEGSGAIAIGLRYGNGEMEHKIEGAQPVHWTGPSIGFDLGGNLSRTFTLVYNLYDTEEIFHRYPAVEGSFYYIGGVGFNYHRRGDVVLVPIRLGVGLRVGANVGYLKYSKKRKIIPF